MRYYLHRGISSVTYRCNCENEYGGGALNLAQDAHHLQPEQEPREEDFFSLTVKRMIDTGDMIDPLHTRVLKGQSDVLRPV